DDRLDPTVLGRAHRLERRVEFGLLVIAPGPLVGHRLVAEAHVLVSEHDAERRGVDWSLHCLYLGHRISSVAQRRGSPQAVSSRSRALRILPAGLRGRASPRTA